jgi:hypothetical protein
MLAPDVSKILPDSVAVIACPFATGAEMQMIARKHKRENTRHSHDGLVRFMTLTPKATKQS